MALAEILLQQSSWYNSGPEVVRPKMVLILSNGTRPWSSVVFRFLLPTLLGERSKRNPPPQKKTSQKLPIQNHPGFIGLVTSNRGPKAMSWVSFFFSCNPAMEFIRMLLFFCLGGGGRQFRVSPSDSIDGCWRCG